MEKWIGGAKRPVAFFLEVTSSSSTAVRASDFDGAENRRRNCDDLLAI